MITDGSLEHDPLKKYYDLEVTNTRPIEQCWQVLFDLWRTAGFCAHLDLHTMGHHLCNPFSYLHPVFYDETDSSFTKDDAYKLAAKMVEYHGVIGLSILVEPPPRTCEERDCGFPRLCISSCLCSPLLLFPLLVFSSLFVSVCPAAHPPFCRHRFILTWLLCWLQRCQEQHVSDNGWRGTQRHAHPLHNTGARPGQRR